MKPKHSVDIQIRFNDIDIAGHVNNAVHFEYFDIARVAYSDAVFGKLIEWKKEGFVLAHTEIDYIEPIFLDDKIKVETAVIHIGEKSLTMYQEIKRRSDEMVLSTCRSVLVAFNYTTQQSMLLPEIWKQQLKAYEEL